MLLHILFSQLENIKHNDQDMIEVLGLKIDSRQVQCGDLFIAYPGAQSDGRDFIKQAIANGAVAILQEGATSARTSVESIPIYTLPFLVKQLGTLASVFYGEPARRLKMIGVTGTNGKTSCTQLLAQALNLLDQPCGVIGSLGNGFLENLHETINTTPDAVTIQQIFASLVSQNASACAMEVSSHALAQARVLGLEFDLGIFTNLTQDHLDYHQTMEAYGKAKERLFSQSHSAIINADDSFGRALLARVPCVQTIAYALQPYPCESAFVFATQWMREMGLTKVSLQTSWGEGVFQTNLLGDFNVSNLLAVLSVLLALEVDFEQALSVLSSLQPVPGRMESFTSSRGELIVVDYAHTPDALEKALQALKPICQGRLWCVFGCGGNRDRTKRPMMASIAERYADELVLTHDNLRYEKPSQIIEDILSGFNEAAKVRVDPDRAKAIEWAMTHAVPQDVILIAGKGREAYQEIEGVKMPLSDIKIINALRD